MTCRSQNFPWFALNMSNLDLLAPRSHFSNLSARYCFWLVPWEILYSTVLEIPLPPSKLVLGIFEMMSS